VPFLDLERTIAGRLGRSGIAGVDEAGRGAIAGPVFAAAVLLPIENGDLERELDEVDDSKKLTPRQRERLFESILAHARSWGIASVGADEIDRTGILPATFRAMELAIHQLDPAADFILVDGPLSLPVAIPSLSVVRGDSLSLSIAAASILAKVSRDRFMAEAELRYPGYGFGQHKGYATPQHLKALDAAGPCPEHRRAFAPLRPMLFALTNA
jgi:ribonuclease HII